jgi:hypothetical protein
VRIRTGDGDEHRFNAIKRVAEYYGCYKTEAVEAACEDILKLAAAAEQFLKGKGLLFSNGRKSLITCQHAPLPLKWTLEVRLNQRFNTVPKLGQSACLTEVSLLRDGRIDYILPS